MALPEMFQLSLGMVERFRESSEQSGSEPHQPEEKGQPTHKARDFESAGGSGDPGDTSTQAACG